MASNTVTAKVTDVGTNPRRLAVSPDGAKVYVTNEGSNNVSVIDASTNKVIGSVNVGMNPYGIAVTPDGKKVYVANSRNSSASVIDTAQNQVLATLNVGNGPNGVALAKSNFPLSGTGNAINDDPKPEPTQSSNISGNGNTKTPCFEIGYGVISLLAVFLYKTSIKK